MKYMKTYRTFNRGLKKTLLFVLNLGLIAAILTVGCPCDPPDPSEIDVTPDCPGGRKAAASITISGDLSGIRPVGTDKLLRIRGNRDTEADLCFAEGAQVSFSQDVTGQGTVSINVSNLAHSRWEITITALSGGDHPKITLDQVLTPGTNHTLSLGSNSAGDITASF